MAFIISTASRNAKANAQLGLINAGTTNPTGAIVFKTSGGITIATCLFSATAFGAASNGSATSNNITRDPASAADGEVAKAELQDRDRVLVGTADVNTTSSDNATLLVIGTTTVKAGQPFEVASIIYTEPTGA